MKTFILILGTLVLGACTADHVGRDSKSNWLRTCSGADQCGSDLECVCGVCTVRCDGPTACKLGGQSAICVDPSEQSAHSECANDSDQSMHICLQPCVEDSECPKHLHCAHGTCASAELTGEVERDAGTTDDAGDSSGDAAIADNSRDSGELDATPRTLPDAGDDAHTTNPGVPIDSGVPIDPSVPRCTVTGRPCCDQNGACEGDLACHIDGSCIEVGVADSDGLVTLSTSVPDNLFLLGADDAFVYGVAQSGLQGSYGSLVRAPVGGGEFETLADGKQFAFKDEFHKGYGSVVPVLLADATNLYFIALGQDDELNMQLWSMPKDDSALPIAHGTAGSHLVGDDQHVYFSDANDARVLRVAKSALDTREQVFESAEAARDTIAGVAINATRVFVVEIPPNSPVSHPSFEIQAVQKTLAGLPETLADQDDFTYDGFPIIANDAFLFVGGMDRYNLVTGDMKSFGAGYCASPLALLGDELHCRSEYFLAEMSELVLIHLASGKKTYLVPDYLYEQDPQSPVGPAVASSAGTFAVISFAGSQSLMRLAPSSQ